MSVIYGPVHTGLGKSKFGVTRRRGPLSEPENFTPLEILLLLLLQGPLLVKVKANFTAEREGFHSPSKSPQMVLITLL
jgi:hypothetical protein